MQMGVPEVSFFSLLRQRIKVLLFFIILSAPLLSVAEESVQHQFWLETLQLNLFNSYQVDLELSADKADQSSYYPLFKRFFRRFLGGFRDPDGDGLRNFREWRIGTNARNADTDDDGLSDGEEVKIYLTNPLSGDTDSDGLVDSFEVKNDFDPLVAGEQLLDSDLDGLNNLAEQIAGTNPHQVDSDGDGLTDRDELQQHGSNPLQSDTDSDGLLDAFEVRFGFSPALAGEQLLDNDNDELNNIEEQSANTHPLVADTDGGGIDDGTELKIDRTNPLDASDDADTFSSFPHRLFDVNNFLWDIFANGSILGGSNNAYQAGLRLQVNGAFFPVQLTGRLFAMQRQVVLSSAVDGLDVVRKVFVPTTQGYARFLEVISNHGEQSRNVELTISSNLGSGVLTSIVDTSDNDQVFTNNDHFLVTDDIDMLLSPPLLHVFSNPDGELAPAEVSLAGSQLKKTFRFDLAPGETKIILHFAAQNIDRTSARNLGVDLLSISAEDLLGTSQHEQRTIVNFGVDSDEDGLVDTDELAIGTDPFVADTDGDGLLDGFEVENGFDPFVDNNDANLDTDGDGLTNIEEQTVGSSPLLGDTDTDGLSDREELIQGTKIRDSDTDRDLVFDGDEVALYFTNPLLADTDNGGVDDGNEIFVDGTSPRNQEDDQSFISLLFTLFDSGNAAWDVSVDGIVTGRKPSSFSRTWDFAAALKINGEDYAGVNPARLQVAGRELVIHSEQLMSGLEVSRRVYVPEESPFVRYLEQLHNPSDMPITVSVSLQDEFSFFRGGPDFVETSSGDTRVTSVDQYMIGDDTSSRITYVAAVAGAGQSPGILSEFNYQLKDEVNIGYQLTVPAKETRSLLHFRAQLKSIAEARLLAPRLVNPDREMMRGLTAQRIQEIANYSLMFDSDDDGLFDSEEAELGTNPDLPDTDGDGLLDGFEHQFGFDPLVAGIEAGLDNDADGLTNIEEQQIGSSPFVEDTDQDGLSDAQELVLGTNPASADTDEDGLSDSDETNIHGTNPVLFDTDNGGASDGSEVLEDGTDPFDPDDDKVLVSLPFLLRDADGFRWDIALQGFIDGGQFGQVGNTTWSFASLLQVNNGSFPAVARGELINFGRELILSSPGLMAGVEVSRRIYVSDDAGFARYIEQFHNPSPQARLLIVTLFDNAASGVVQRETSSGDSLTDTADTYVIASQSSNRNLAVVAVTGAIEAENRPKTFTATQMQTRYSYNVFVPGGETVSIMHFRAQSRSIEQARLIAARFERPAGAMLAGLSPKSLAQIQNYKFDKDLDGLSDSDELILGTDIDNPDTDGDGLLDGFENRFGFNLLVDDGDALLDSDGDGLNNLAEQAADTSPTTADTDGDGLSDGQELSRGTDPRNTDTDDDGLNDGDEVSRYNTNPLLVDSDGGGAPDGEEVLVDFTNPINPVDDVVAVELPHVLIDGERYRWGFAGAGFVDTSGSLDGGFAPWLSAAAMNLDGQFYPSQSTAKLKTYATGQELNFAIAPVSGIDVSRRVFVPSDDGFVRYVETLHNPSTVSRTLTVGIGDRLRGTALLSGIETSSGDRLLTSDDNYLITGQAGVAGALVVAASDQSAALGLSNFSLAFSNSVDMRFSIDIPAGATASVMHFRSQAADFIAAKSLAARLESPSDEMLVGLSLAELDLISNYNVVRDSDGDGLSDFEEQQLGSNPNDPDTDSDGLQDGFEVAFGFDLIVDSGEANVDTDGDGLTNIEEQEEGSSPLSNDSDQDGLLDAEELALGTNLVLMDSDGDRLGDGDEVLLYGTDPTLEDTDQGGVGDGVEVLDHNSNPLNGNDDRQVLQLPHSFFDGDGFEWPITNNGEIGSNSIGSGIPVWDFASRISFNGLSFPNQSEAMLTGVGGRSIALHADFFSAFEVTRMISVPSDAAYIRYIDQIHNTSSRSLFLTVRLIDDLFGVEAPNSVIASNGLSTVSPLSNYVALHLNNGSYAATVVSGAGMPRERPDKFSLANTDDVVYDYILTIPVGESVSIMHFNAQANSLAEAEMIAQSLTSAGVSVLSGVSVAIASEIVNFDIDLTLFDTDTDADGLNEYQEWLQGTDPNNFDTDGDGLLDGFEVANGSDPLSANAVMSIVADTGSAIEDLLGDEVRSDFQSGTASQNEINVPVLPAIAYLVLVLLLLAVRRNAWAA